MAFFQEVENCNLNITEEVEFTKSYSFEEKPNSQAPNDSNCLSLQEEDLDEILEEADSDREKYIKAKFAETIQEI